MTDKTQEEATRWLVRQHSGDWSKVDQTAFEDWLSHQPQHRQAYLQAKRNWDAMEPFKTLSFPELAGARAYNAVKQQRSLCQHGLVRTVFSLLLLLFSDHGLWQLNHEEYQTLKGQQLSLVLTDGTRIELNTDTQLTVDYTRYQRTILLKQGEALFTVAADPERPFLVKAASGTIRDIGTRFNVYKQAEQVYVLVSEGQIKMTTDGQHFQRLEAGQELVYSAQEMSAIKQSDIEMKLAWREGSFIFRAMPLAQVLNEIARYHPYKIELIDSQSQNLQQLKVSGKFQFRDLDGLLKMIEASLGVKLKRTRVSS